MFETLPQSVRIVEVGPRDGLQNESTPVTTEDKFTFIKMLMEAGLPQIELTSFVRPDAIPQLSDADELIQMLKDNGITDMGRFTCLVPNMKGMEKAHAAGMKEIAIFVATSDSFSKRNINATVDESFDRLAPVCEFAKEHNIRVRGYLSTIFGCPYEGNMPPEKALELSHRLLAIGCYEVSLGDTIGIGSPKQTSKLLELLLHEIPANKLAMHLHDTHGMALANIAISLDMGITTFDASAGGLGGCPYADGASGNVATEDVVHLCKKMGIDTGVDIDKLTLASDFILKKINKQSPSKIHQLLSH